MRKYTLFALLYLSALNTHAQSPFNTIEFIDANKINAAVLVHGDMWWNPETSTSTCFFPNGTSRTSNFASALWMSAYDDAGQLHVAAQTYRKDGNDYWPGPLDASGSLDYSTSEKWAKIWKVRRSEIDAHRAITFHNTSNTPESILTWPAKGNAYAKGKDGVPLSITEDMAPFVDGNGDGIYSPLKGDYPDFQGEQALWWVFSDNGPTHNQSDGTPLKVQVHVMAYAFTRNTLIDQVVYYNYTLINKSVNSYHDMRMALWDDVNVGYYMDDYIGFDSTWRMGIGYDATMPDGGGAGGPSNSYGLWPPAVGVTFVSLPGDVGSAYVPAGSYMTSYNDHSIIGTPTAPQEYDYYMRSRFRDGSHLKYNADTASVINRGVDRNYIYADDPTVPDGWNECTFGATPGDRSFIIASNDFGLPAGGRQRVVMALLIDTTGSACPAISFNGIRKLADTAWGNWHTVVATPHIPLQASGLSVYPNPVNGILHISVPGSERGVLTIYNAIGLQMLQSPLTVTGSVEADVNNYPPGVYFISLHTITQAYHATFLKK